MAPWHFALEKAKKMQNKLGEIRYTRKGKPAQTGRAMRTQCINAKHAEEEKGEKKWSEKLIQKTTQSERANFCLQFDKTTQTFNTPKKVQCFMIYIENTDATPPNHKKSKNIYRIRSPSSRGQKTNDEYFGDKFLPPTNYKMWWGISGHSTNSHVVSQYIYPIYPFPINERESMCVAVEWGRRIEDR